MTGMNRDDKQWHDTYERLPEAIRGEIDAAYKQCAKVLRSGGMDLCNSDGAEAFVAAMTRYVVESNPAILGELLPEAV